jgi:hypothetical protein
MESHAQNMVDSNMPLSTRTLYQQASKANGQHLEENDRLFGKHPRIFWRFSRIAVSKCYSSLGQSANSAYNCNKPTPSLGSQSEIQTSLRKNGVSVRDACL